MECNHTRPTQEPADYVCQSCYIDTIRKSFTTKVFGEPVVDERTRHLRELRQKMLEVASTFNRYSHEFNHKWDGDFLRYFLMAERALPREPFDEGVFREDERVAPFYANVLGPSE